MLNIKIIALQKNAPAADPSLTILKILQILCRYIACENSKLVVGQVMLIMLNTL